MKPQEPIPHNYSISKLNLIFALSSLVLLAATGLIVGYDYVRGWKWFQMEFMRIQRERIESDLKAANDADTRKRVAELGAQMKTRQTEIARERGQYVEAKKDLEQWEGKHYAADQDYRFAKAVLDVKRYELEVGITQKRGDLPRRQREFDDYEERVAALNLRLQDVTKSRDAARARVDKWEARLAELETKRKELTASIDLLNRQLFAVSENRDFFILNSPVIDFVSPTLKVDQVVLGDLFIDMNYMSVPRVDRCMTCHRAIDRPGFESKKEAARLAQVLKGKLDKNLVEPARRVETEERVGQLQRIVDAPADILNPFRTHPKLDVYVGSSSPHPLLEYGCTACHRGQDRATEFGRAGHTPASKKMEARWKKTAMPFFPTKSDFEKRNWGYQVNPFLDTPMYPRQHYEAGCIKCHAGQVQVTGGEHITKATLMVELYGCHACHKINNWRFSELRKPGPSLDGIAEKTSREFVMRWLANPSKFRPTTRMPSFFYQRNMVGPAVPERERVQNIKFQDAEIHAITEYLFTKSTTRQWAGGSGGDAARGKQLVESIGCMACHVAQDTITKSEEEKQAEAKAHDKGDHAKHDDIAAPVPEGHRVARRTDFPLERNYGFNLVGTGTKTHPAWLYNWVRNPKNYYKSAPMPSLRLSDQEASDITAYLMTLQKPQFVSEPFRAPDPAAVRTLAKGYLTSTLTDREADAKLGAMPLREQLVYLGQRSIEKYGCYSCHELKGFENIKPIGAELTAEGSKTLHLFDFGFAHDYAHEDGSHEHILHTVPSWIYNKVRSPRIYDDARTKPYGDKLKMPNFHMTPEEARLVTSVVLGLTKERVADAKMAAHDARSRVMEEGRKLVSQHNCRGCHVVDRNGRAVAALIEDDAYWPPDLSPQGARAQSDWLFNFLKDPTVMKIRPWMSVRMPTFHFEDSEASKLVSYFAAAGQVPQFDTTKLHQPPAANVAIGREVFGMLRCAQCHSIAPANPENPPFDAADTTALAPNLTFSRIRLRHDWIADWIRRPDEMIPGTRMPTNFPRNAETGGFTSPLAGAIDSAQFAAQKARLLPYFRSEEDLRKTMGDAVALTSYLRDYIWSIGITQMRAASPEGEPPVMNLPQQPQQPRTPPQLPAEVRTVPATPVRRAAAER
jgi:cytochrome c2